MICLKRIDLVRLFFQVACAEAARWSATTGSFVKLEGRASIHACACSGFAVEFSVLGTALFAVTGWAILATVRPRWLARAWNARPDGLRGFCLGWLVNIFCAGRVHQGATPAAPGVQPVAPVDTEAGHSLSGGGGDRPTGARPKTSVARPTVRVSDSAESLSPHRSSSRRKLVLEQRRTPRGSLSQPSEFDQGDCGVSAVDLIKLSGRWVREESRQRQQPRQQDEQRTKDRKAKPEEKKELGASAGGVGLPSDKKFGSRGNVAFTPSPPPPYIDPEEDEVFLGLVIKDYLFSLISLLILACFF